ncbi:MAG: NTP transferase domain-containing protein [Cyclobacteriaceae bacterium]
MKKHVKHAKITKANIGRFNKTEFAILGTPCVNIKKLSFEIISRLSSKYNIGYVDADHKGADEGIEDSNSALTYGATNEYVDKIDFNRFDQKHSLNEFDFRQNFSHEDAVLINGNHYLGQKQIIVIDAKKPLEKKLNKLTDVVLVLFQEGASDIPQYLSDHIPNIDELPKFQLNDVDEVARFVEKEIEKQAADLNGLVLAGGKSTRMNCDKGKIQYHGIEQRVYMKDLLSRFTKESFISIRADQQDEFLEKINVIEDVHIGLGPYGAILSAFQKNPNIAWLVTACDQPLLNEDTLKYLIQNRNPSKLATAFHNSETQFPEPLITIWEPRAYARLLYFLSLGYSCPRKVLINSDIELVKLDDEKVLKNANTPEEYQALTQELKI